MANINGPSGFKYIGTTDGQGPNFGIQTYQISSTNGSSIFTGDVLAPLSGGYTTVQTAASAASGVLGIALGFEWLSKTAGTKVFRPFWLGATTDVASGNVAVKVAGHGEAIFEVQCKVGPIVASNVGQSVNFAASSSGNTTSGISGMTIDDSTLSNIYSATTLPFRIYDVQGVLPGAPNYPPYDTTTAYNRVKVTFNTTVLSGFIAG